MSAPARPRLSVAIVACNEEENLRRTLPSVAHLASEIVLLDSGSRDGTAAVARSFGAVVHHVPWMGFGAQKNRAIAACTGEWILSLDADEEVSPELAREIGALLASSPSQPAAYTMPRRNYFLGRWLRHGGLYPDRKLRLFARGRARFTERAVHESMQADVPAAALTGALIHHAYPTLESYLEHMNRYSTLAAAQALARDQGSRRPLAFAWNVLLNPLATFVYNYVVRLGFLDGREGLLQHLYHSCYVSWKYAKAWEQSRPSRKQHS